METPFLLFSDYTGKIQAHPYLRMAASGLNKYQVPKEAELMRFPKGSTLFYLPGRPPLGFNPGTKRIEVLEEFAGKKAFAVAAFPIPGILRLYNPASLATKKRILPLWAYTACGFLAGNYYIAAKRVDKRIRQSPQFYNNSQIARKAKSFLKKYPRNRLGKHLVNCALNYNCLAAKNFFLQRWEAPLPTSRLCNSQCLGCLSYQRKDCQASHQRINFKPRPKEIRELMISHLKVARQAIVSFGQGCEGEPLLEAKLIADSIYKVRAEVSCGTINMNTNASLPQKIKLLCQAGIDSFRVSLNSPQEKFYNLYFKPKGYKFKDVLKSIDIAKKYRKFVSLNLFVFPGFSDSRGQIKSLIKLVRNKEIDMIQWRNLNIDPDYYSQVIGSKSLKPQGILSLLAAIKSEFPGLKTGYFNLPKEDF